MLCSEGRVSWCRHDCKRKSLKSQLERGRIWFNSWRELGRLLKVVVWDAGSEMPHCGVDIKRVDHLIRLTSLTSTSI